MAMDDTPQEATPASDPVDLGFLVSLEDRGGTWFLDFLSPDDPQRYYVSAREPGLRADEITNAGLNFSYDQARKGFRQEKGKTRVGEMTVTGNPMPVRQFLAKCRIQITDFCLPGKDRQGKRVDFKYNPANQGDNFENGAVYQHLYPVAQIREEVEAFLDWLAGTRNEATEEFEILKNEQPGRLRIS